MKRKKEVTNDKPPANMPLEKGPPEIKVKKAFTLRPYMLVVSALVGVVGVALFIMYFFSLNMIFGAPSIFMIGAGFFTFRYYWKKRGDNAVEHIGDVPKEQMNSLNIYPKELKFENTYEPKGYPWECLNDGMKYYVNIWNVEEKKLLPFELPDQSYYDPGVFAERVLGLPAHRKIFLRKPKLFEKLKPALLVLAIAVVWLLIMTTTAGGG